MSIVEHLTADARRDVEDYIRGFDQKVKTGGMEGVVEWWCENRRVVERLLEGQYADTELIYDIVDAVTTISEESTTSDKLFRIKTMFLLGFVLLHPPSWSQNKIVSAIDRRLKIMGVVNLAEDAETIWRETWEFLKSDFFGGLEPNRPEMKEDEKLVKLVEGLKSLRSGSSVA